VDAFLIASIQGHAFAGRTMNGLSGRMPWAILSLHVSLLNFRGREGIAVQDLVPLG
jgi:hypothetical protein